MTRSGSLSPTTPLTGIISVLGSTSSGAPSSSQRRIVAISSSVRLQSWSNGTLSSLAGHGGMKRVSVTMAIAKAARDTSSAVSKRTCCVPGPSPVWQLAQVSVMIGWMLDANDTAPGDIAAGAVVVATTSEVVVATSAVAVESPSPVGTARSLPAPSPQAPTTTARNRHVPAPNAHDRRPLA